MECVQKINIFVLIIFVWCKFTRNYSHAILLEPQNSIDSALKKITWLKHIIVNGNNVKMNGRPKRPTASNPSEFYQLAIGPRDEPFDACVTPRRTSGHCRYIQHCILSDFVNSYRVFLKYLCFIEGQYVGVCCPDSRDTGKPTSPTRRPALPPDIGKCGASNKQQPQVVGGRPARVDDYPWMAALLRNEEQHCGGVLITKRHVLTAAHCVEGYERNSLLIRLGEYTFDDNHDTNSKDFSLTSIIKHESYDSSTYVNDIAMLTLDSEADGSYMSPICLPPPGKSFAGKIGTVIGWGSIFFGGPSSDILLEVNIPVWGNAECDAAYNLHQVFDVNICAGNKEGGKGSCQGDSGGPLMYKENHQWMVIGLVSWAIGCGEPGRPGVYVRVSEFLSWIQQNSRT